MKTKSDWGKSKINELVEAVECIASKNKSWNGELLYAADYFQKWVKDFIIKRLGFDCFQPIDSFGE